MSKVFLDNGFLLNSEAAEILYHEFAKDMPIIDYHNHLPPDQVSNDIQFDNITQIWLYGDHYKWRAMRTLGVDEKYCTGNASDWEKFEQWANTVPYAIRNPLYHWTHLELQRYFGIKELLNASNAKSIFDECNRLLKLRDYSVNGLMTRMKVEQICTTDDPADDLAYHINSVRIKFGKMRPTFRPDKYLLVQSKQYNEYVITLGIAANITIQCYEDLVEALLNRALFFRDNGCVISDLGLESIPCVEINEKLAGQVFIKAMAGEEINDMEASTFQITLLVALCKIYHELGWAQQFHLGAFRNNNTRAYTQLGPDTGWDSIGDINIGKGLVRFLQKLDETDQLGKTIIYNLNPKDNELIATMIGNFNDGSSKGKIQFGSAWWFLDQKDGMQKQINALSNMGLLSCFIGMLTDSRSFLSFPRHEYFRRILCNMLGEEIDNGELPNDMPHIGSIVQDICYYNIKNYLHI